MWEVANKIWLKKFKFNPLIYKFILWLTNIIYYYSGVKFRNFKNLKFKLLNFKDNGLSSSSRLKKLIFLGIKTLLINNLKLFLKMFILKL